MTTNNGLYSLTYISDTLGFSRQKLEDAVRKRKIPMQGKVMQGSKSVRVLRVLDVIAFYGLKPVDMWINTFMARVIREKNQGTLDAAQRLLTETPLDKLQWTE